MSFTSLRIKVSFKETKQPAQGPTGRKGWAKIQTLICWSLTAALSTEEEEVTCHKAETAPFRKEQEIDYVIIPIHVLTLGNNPKPTRKHGAVTSNNGPASRIARQSEHWAAAEKAVLIPDTCMSDVVRDLLAHYAELLHFAWWNYHACLFPTSALKHKTGKQPENALALNRILSEF